MHNSNARTECNHEITLSQACALGHAAPLKGWEASPQKLKFLNAADHAGSEDNWRTTQAFKNFESDHNQFVFRVDLDENFQLT